MSMPADSWLPPNLNELKWAVVDEVARRGYAPEIFTNPRGGPSLASGTAWSAAAAEEIARRCIGAVVIGMARWDLVDAEGQRLSFPTEYNHYEGAVARTLGLPVLVLVQRDVVRRVLFDSAFGGFIGKFDGDADPTWVERDDFRVPFRYWTDQLGARRDVFLGYSSSSQRIATLIKQFLERRRVTVLDWRTDFTPGTTILQQIEEAADRCTGGVFLFTKDDALTVQGQPDRALPRDNVVFEAGYFIAAKGKRRVLIVREAGSKMPADLGGDIYAALPDQTKLAPIARVLDAFVASL
jgi:hypothetical protein